MRNLETELDQEFEKMGVKIHIFHHRFLNIYALWYAGVTIATEHADWDHHTLLQKLRESMNTSKFDRIDMLISNLKEKDLPGVAICNSRDHYNRRIGRIIAKGRLLKEMQNR